MADSTFFRLLNGRPKADKTFDEANILSADQKAGIDNAAASITGANPVVEDSDSRLTDARDPNSHGNEAHDVTFITASGVTYENLDNNGDVGTGASTVAAGDDSRFLTSDQKAGIAAAPNAITGSNPATDKQYVDGLIQGVDWQESVEHTVDYVKTDAGAPSGTATDGEKCLNTNEDKLYTYSSGWDAGAAVSSGDRHVHKDTGDDDSGDSGTHTKSDKIYEFTGTAQTYTETAANEGMTFWAEDEDVAYVYNGSNYVKLGSTVTHANLSGLQGGAASEYYHLTSNQEAGMDAATAITASNPPLTKADRDMVPLAYKFIYQGGFPISQTDVELYEANGSLQRIVMPSNGSLVKATMQATSDRTAGTLTAEPTIDGTKVTENALDMVFDGSKANDDYAEVAPATTNLTFSAGEKIGVKLTSDGSWAPTDEDIEVTLYVVFDS